MAQTQEEICRRLIAGGVVAIVRLDSADGLDRVAEALIAGGVTALEFTLTTPGALPALEAAAARHGDRLLLGAGTVLDAETARTAILAGAEFIVAPTTDLPTIALCRRYAKVCLPGAFTPTEMLRAYEAGADLIKLFPATTVGPRYIRDVLAPLPMLRIVPTGGIGPENAGDFIKAGAVAVAMGSSLVDAKTVREGRYEALTARAEQAIAAVSAARDAGRAPAGVAGDARRG
jgi:2-dehydro-3-deoxyphosphogluconate aldolase/(4S)-4-hydroxy-2-oxoglutarate aldolase